jgi:hypothetical protein
MGMETHHLVILMSYLLVIVLFSTYIFISLPSVKFNPISYYARNTFDLPLFSPDNERRLRQIFLELSGPSQNLTKEYSTSIRS